MEIDNWDIKKIKEVEFKTFPDRADSPTQRMITYEFKYIPTNFMIPRTIHLIEPHSEQKLLVVLTNFVRDMKVNFIDQAL